MNFYDGNIFNNDLVRNTMHNSIILVCNLIITKTITQLSK